MMRGLGISHKTLEKPDARLPFETTLKLFERARELTGDDLFGFHLSQSPDLVKKAGLLAYVGLSAPTLGGYLRNITRFQRVLGDASRSELNEGTEVSTLCWHYDVSAAFHAGQYAEFGATGTLFALRKYTNRTLRPQHVKFAHVRADNIAAFKRFFGCQVMFGHSENEIAFHSRDLSIPLQTADDNLQAALRAICETTLAQLPLAPNSMSHRVEKLITTGLASGRARLDLIAPELGLSPKTLSRRLSEEETSFVRLVDNLRKALARDYLKDSELPLTEVAFLLGYSDASSFSTAFRRWYHQSPRAFRSQAKSQPPR